MIKYLGQENYKRELRSEHLPVLLNVWHNGNTISKRMSTIIEKFDSLHSNKCQVIKLRAEEYDKFSMDENVHEYPSHLLLHKGNVLAKIVGYVDLDTLVSTAEKHFKDLWT